MMTHRPLLATAGFPNILTINSGLVGLLFSIYRLDDVTPECINSNDTDDNAKTHTGKDINLN